MTLVRRIAVAAAVLLTATAAASAQAPKSAVKQPTASKQAAPKQAKASLKSEAKIKEADARKTALADVPNGKVTKHQLERQDGKVVYAYSIRVQGKPGYEAVQVDAVTGQIVKHEHEDAKPSVAKKSDANKAAKKS